MKNIITNIVSIALIIWIGMSEVIAQQIIFDQGIRAGEITAFPVINKPNDYYYLSDKIVLSKHANGQPQFSFIKYAKNTDSETTSTSFSESNKAGGVLHALVELSVSEEIKSEAERELRRVNPNAKLLGPIIYKSGRISIISSIIGEDGSLTQKVVGIGSAPILEGQKAAVSVLLTKEGADILWATFQTPTPDLSFQFEMDAKGFLSPKRVKIEADFEQIYKHTSFEAAVVTPVLAAEIKTAFDDLSNSGAIKVEQIGEDADLNKLKETAYNQLVNLMFDKVGGQSVANLNAILPNQKSMLDRATEMLGKARTEARTENARLRTEATARAERNRRARERSRSAMDSIYRARGVSYKAVNQPTSVDDEPDVNEVPIPGLAVAASFQMKQIKRTGKYVIDLNKYTEDVKSFPFAENIGGFIAGCTSCFNRINIEEDLYKQRDIQASLSDISSDDFGPYISNVEVLLQKKHQNGEVTNANAIISKNTFNTKANLFIMQYGWKGDDDRAKWLKYNYKTRWTFSGGHVVENVWKEQEFGTIPLSPPLVKKDIYVEIDPTFAQENNIRAAEVKIYYKIGERESQKLIKLNISNNEMSKSVQIILPKDTDDYKFEMVLFVKGSAPIKKAKTLSNFGSIYIDSL